MAQFLVFSESSAESIKKNTLGILEKLNASGHEIEVAIIGNIEQGSVDLIKKYPVRRINLLKGNSIKEYSPEGYVNAVHYLLNDNDFDYVVAGTSAICQDFLPRLSAIFDTGLASGIRDFYFKDERLFCIKEIYGGKCEVNIEFLGTKPRFITVKPGSFHVSNDTDYHDCEITDVEIPDCDIYTHLCEIKSNPSKRPPLDSADIVVAGGRGLGDENKLAILEELADILGASLGASGGAVSCGYAPDEYLIGQTGTQISPLLYIACGISGAMQHLAGIRNANKILSINSDPDTPLMRIADYAVVGDLYDIVPILTRQLKEMKSGNTS